MDELIHLNGIAWWEAPVPRRWHRCKTQTEGVLPVPPGDRWAPSGEELIERCACGAIQFDGTGWTNKNSRRKVHHAAQ